MEITGREEEIRVLQECYDSGKPEFVAVYGRRRIGKTFLVKETFRDRFDFYATGIVNGAASRQLQTFTEAVNEYAQTEHGTARDWFEAFNYLKDHLKVLLSKRPNRRILVFLDELPWFDTQRSGFFSALDYFWNSFASDKPALMLIACGSAASWMVNKLIKDTGGLHNRVTRRILLMPFSLAETKRYLESNGLRLSPYQVIETFMALGGVPFYLSLLRKSKSPTQNINDLCFKSGGDLTSEFDVLYTSLFKKAKRHMQVVEALAVKNKGLTRNEIAQLSGLPNGGTLTDILDELELSGFIRSYAPFGRKTRGSLYQLVDFFTLFYFNFMKNLKANDDEFWIHVQGSGMQNAWSGYAFEQVCQWHIRQIKDALGIAGILTSVSSWRSEKSDPGAQIDLVIDRSDGTINLCEIKYVSSEYVISRDYDRKLRNKVAAFERETKTRKALHTTFITVYGLAQNEYANNVQSEVTADALFKE